MDMSTDPHVLVALTSATIGQKIRVGDAERSHTTNLRTFPVLDVIASLSVFAPKSQVIAVALQMDNDEIRLTIAENGEVTQAVIDHITDVWTLMRTL